MFMGRFRLFLHKVTNAKTSLIPHDRKQACQVSCIGRVTLTISAYLMLTRIQSINLTLETARADRGAVLGSSVILSNHKGAKRLGYLQKGLVMGCNAIGSRLRPFFGLHLQKLEALAKISTIASS